MFERFSCPGRRLIVRAQEGAMAAAALRDVGVSSEVVLGHFEEALDVCDEPAPSAVDPEALEAIGIDLTEVKRRIEESFGPGALEFTGAWRDRDCGWPTPLAKKVLERALREALRTGSERVGSEHVLMGLCKVPEALGARLLERQVPLDRLCLAVVHHLRRSA